MARVDARLRDKPMPAVQRTQRIAALMTLSRPLRNLCDLCGRLFGFY